MVMCPDFPPLSLQTPAELRSPSRDKSSKTVADNRLCRVTSDTVMATSRIYGSHATGITFGAEIGVVQSGTEKSGALE